MKPLSNRAQAILCDYRAAEALGASARARIFDKLGVRIAAQDWPADGMDVPPQEPLTQGLLAKALAGPLGKIGLALIVATVPSAWLLHSANEQPAILTGLPPRWHESFAGQVVIEPESLPRETASPVPADNLVIAPSATGHASLAKATPLPSARARRRTSVQEPNPSEPLDPAPDPMELKAMAPPASGAVPGDMIDEEVRLLSQAHAALRAGRPQDALGKLKEHAQSFPNSKLAEARQVARMIALCDSGRRAAARAEAQAFLSARPRSPLANRVRNICAAPGRKEHGP